MIKIIFTFSYLGKENLISIKNSFFDNDNYKLGFLTRNNFDSYFNNNFYNIKNILYGKYLILTISNVDYNYLEFKNEINKIKEIINSLNIELKIFAISHNSDIYFPSFLEKSEKYNNKNLYNIIKFNNNFNNYNIFMYNYFVYNKISSSIINLVTTQNSNIYVSYMY